VFRLRRLVPVAVAVVVAAGCATGPRPHFEDEQQNVIGGATGASTGDPAADKVLALLEGEGAPSFTATYSITRKLGPNETTGTVVKDGSSLSITVGDVRFLGGAKAETCSVSGHTCQDGTVDARISDYSIASTFWAGGPARALRVALSRRAGPTVASSQTIGGADATCVDVPVGAGVEHYCAVAQGAIARWDTAAVSVNLTGITPAADPAAFRAPG
jgi:hypothetical protein